MTRFLGGTATERIPNGAHVLCRNCSVSLAAPELANGIAAANPWSDAWPKGEHVKVEAIEGEMKPGRWPANVCHDGSNEVLDAFATYGERGAIAPVHTRSADKFRNVYNGSFAGNVDEAGSTFQGDSGTAARFFYSSKATQGERVFECRECGAHTLGRACEHSDVRTHPTVKPISLMRWLVEMVCPVGGLVLDPFAGTGTMAAAAQAAGMQSLSIEADADHVRDIGVRLSLPVDDLLAATVEPVAVDHGDQMDMFT